MTCVFVSARAPVHCVLCAEWFVLFLLLVLCGLPVCVCVLWWRCAVCVCALCCVICVVVGVVVVFVRFACLCACAVLGFVVCGV